MKILITGNMGYVGPGVAARLRAGTVTIVVMGVLIVGSTLWTGTWCRYLCPLGALIGLGSKFSWIQRRVSQMSCVQCGDCAAICPMGAISPDQDYLGVDKRFYTPIERGARLRLELQEGILRLIGKMSTMDD